MVRAPLKRNVRRLPLHMDQSLSDTYIGKHLLVGITYLDHNEALLEKRQLHGHIVRINEHEGIVLKLFDSDEEFKLPPQLEALRSAQPGEYRLRETGEIVVNPDLLGTWTVVKPEPEN